MKDLKVICRAIFLSIALGMIVKMALKTSKRHNGTTIDSLNILKMANIDKANLGYILRWEGGLSKHERDSASRHPVPDGSGYHTNKGVTWRVFASIYGTSNTAISRFYEMTHADFKGIYKLYWNGVKADLIQSQILGEYVTDFAWGSGVAGASRQVQKWLNTQGYKVAIDGKIGMQTVTAINQLIKTKGEKAAFESLNAHRRHFLSQLRDFDVFGKGWFNRLNDFIAYAYLTINGKS
jgi:lysozyme family protein